MVILICQAVVTSVLLVWFMRMTNGMPDPTHRDLLMRQEASRQTGGRVTLTAAEQKLDAYLHELKEQEMSAAQFPPALHFFKAKPLIQQSSIFKLLQKMPKGDAGAQTQDSEPNPIFVFVFVSACFFGFPSWFSIIICIVCCIHHIWREENQCRFILTGHFRQHVPTQLDYKGTQNKLETKKMAEMQRDTDYQRTTTKTKCKTTSERHRITSNTNKRTTKRHWIIKKTNWMTINYIYLV